MSAVLALTPADRKRFCTLQATALVYPAEPVQLIAIEGDDGRPEFVVWRDAATKRCKDLDEVERVLPEFGVTPMTYEQLVVAARASAH